MPTAIITGITGQDGSYLAELLLDNQYEVLGLVRRTSHGKQFSKISHLLSNSNLTIVEGDVTDATFINRWIKEVQPDQLYHLAAQSFVPPSWAEPQHTLEANTMGTLFLLEAIRHYSKHTRMYFAGSSEQFGLTPAPQNEDSPFYPRSPYAVSKVASYHLVRNYRESFNLFVCSGITFNHTSPRRGENFVTRKITKAVANIYLGKQACLELGDISTSRDWSYAKEVVEAFYLMLNRNSKPRDYVIASGKSTTVEQFLTASFTSVGLDWKKYTTYNSNTLTRLAEVPELRGDSSRLFIDLGWTCTTPIDKLAQIMVQSDIEAIKSRE